MASCVELARSASEGPLPRLRFGLPATTPVGDLRGAKKPAARSVRFRYQHRAASWDFVRLTTEQESGRSRHWGNPSPGGAATRKPRLLFRSDGPFLLRYAARQFWPL